MKQVSVTLNNRTYRLACEDGDESRLIELAAHVKERVERLTLEFGQVGDERLLLMASLLIADELWDTRQALEVQIEEATEMLRQLTEPPATDDTAKPAGGGSEQAKSA
ncbi:MAG: cell division protein ZapA [Hyphomicrobiaceae bacterium]